MSATPALPAEVAAALAAVGFAPASIELLSPLGERKGMRLAYRVEAADGRVLKLRHCTSEEEARALQELRAALDPAFAPVVDRRGSVLFEEWIAGTPLSPVEAEERVDEAGALLARLHLQPLPAEAASAQSTARWRTAAASDIELLSSGGALSSGDAERLNAHLDRADPRLARVTLTHLDFCAENFVCDEGGRLRVIDNERVGLGAPGFDLGWTRHRWPMSDAGWRRFLAAYRDAGGEIEALAFWQIAAALTCTRVFFQRMPERLENSLTRLRRFAAEGGA